MTTPTERVAEAIWQATLGRPAVDVLTWDEQNDTTRKVFGRMAQAAIDALGLTEQPEFSDFDSGYVRLVGPWIEC